MDVFGIINDNAALFIALVIASSVVVMVLSLAWEKLFGGYEPRVYLYTKAEHNFYRQLINRLPRGYVVNGANRNQFNIGKTTAPKIIILNICSIFSRSSEPNLRALALRRAETLSYYS